MPCDNTNPVIYDYDGAIDVYTDEYLLALASTGEIRLKGMMTLSSIAPYNPWVSPDDFEHGVIDR